MNKFFCKEKSTVIVKFKVKPVRFEVLNDNAKVYFFRELDNKFLNVKFNICHKGFYTMSEECESIDVLPIQIVKSNIQLPPIERNRFRDFKIVYNKNLMSTPARNFTFSGIIETGRNFNTYAYPIRLFILCHEVGHFFYAKEENADLYACKIFLENGYNPSSALYALTRVLNANINNKKRILNLFKNINS